MSYRVFARKYRPQTFEEVVGQDHITRTLKNAIGQNRLAQAYLFVGPRGIGKTSSARILAKALNCEKGVTAEPCGECNSCREIAEGRSLDVIEIDGASNNNVDNIRDLRENVAYAPARGPFKIYLIDEVHMLSTGAFNALLKTLEEPPAHVKFLFATTEAQKVPATITSRCQRFDLRPIPAELIASHLLHIAAKESIDLEPEAADTLARGADGGLRDAESMFDQVVAFCGTTVKAADVMDVFGFTSREVVASIVEKLLDADAPGALAELNAQAQTGKDLPRLLADLIGWLRDLLLFQIHPDTNAPHPAMPDQAARISREKLLELLDHFTEWDGRMRWSVDKKLQMEVALIKAVHLLEQASLSDVIDTLASIGGGTAAATPARPVAATRSKPAVQPANRTQSAPPAAARATPTQNSPAPVEKPPAAASKPTPQPAEKPAPAPAGASGPDTVWREVTARLAAEAQFRFGWLETGEFVDLRGDTLIVRFPESQRASAESILWEEHKKTLNAQLSKKFGATIKLQCEFVPDPERPAEPAAAESAPPEALRSEAPATEPDRPAPAEPVKQERTQEEIMEEFKNDPVIRKALDFFQAEIISSPS